MNTKTPLALAVAALLLVGTTACNRNDDAAGGTNNTPAPDAGAPNPITDTKPAGPAVPPGTEGAMPSQTEALALLNAVNDHEVKAAEMAKSKNVTGPVLEYANMMQADHGKNMSDTTALMQTLGGAGANAGAAGAQAATAGTDSARVGEQRAKAEARRAQLQGLQGEAFARGYMEEMVSDHAAALTLIDSMLLPAASDAALKSHLTATRGHVQHHLERAREIQAQLGGATTGAAGGGTGG